MIIIAGSIYIPADKRAACLAAGEKFQAGTRADEPGCLAYVFSADPLVPTTMSVYEIWQDAASLEAHFQHANYHAMRGVFAEHGITGADVAKYRVDAHGPVYNDKGVASASFG